MFTMFCDRRSYGLRKRGILRLEMRSLDDIFIERCGTIGYNRDSNLNDNDC